MDFHSFKVFNLHEGVPSKIVLICAISGSMIHLPNFNFPKFDRSQIFARISRKISSRQPIAIAYIAVLIILTWLVTSCIHNDDSIQYLNVVGSCNKQTSIALIDESRDSNDYVNMLPEKRRLFKQYARNISQYLFAKIDAMGHCQGGWMRDPEVEFVFVYRLLVGKAKFDALANFNISKSPDIRILDSPWVKMRIDRSPKLVVKAVFFWNERQFLFDQAVLSKNSSLPTPTLLPLEKSIYKRYLDDYTNSVEVIPWKIMDDPSLQTHTSNWQHKRDKLLQKAEKSRLTALSNISKRLPADLIWLFGHSGIRGENSGNTESSMYYFIVSRSDRYIDLTKTLLNLSFSSEQQEQKYTSILDLNGLFDINKYQID